MYREEFQVDAVMEDGRHVLAWAESEFFGERMCELLAQGAGVKEVTLRRFDPGQTACTQLKCMPGIAAGDAQREELGRLRNLVGELQRIFGVRSLPALVARVRGLCRARAGGTA